MLSAREFTHHIGGAETKTESKAKLGLYLIEEYIWS